MRDFLSVEAWKEAAKQGTSDGAIRKQFLPEVKANDEKRTLTFTITTNSVDRQSDTISADGWDVEAYRKNPVMLWAHDYSMLPIGRATKIWRDGSAWKAEAEFTPQGLVKFNDIVYELYKSSFMNAVSVGFRPKEWEWSKDKERPYGIDFKSQELLEFSAVPVPANAEALVEARSAGHDVEELRSWALDVLSKTGKPENVREFEDVLRGLGFSRREAELICSKGFRIPQGEPVAAPAPTQTNDNGALTAEIAVGLRMKLWNAEY